MESDIVDRLRLYSERMKETRSTVLGLLLSDSANEIERLHRDYLCICSEMRRMMEERDEARWRLCKVVGDNRGVWGCEIAKENGWHYLATEDKP